MYEIMMNVFVFVLGITAVIAAFAVAGGIGIGAAWIIERLLCLLILNQKNRIRKILGIDHIVPYSEGRIKI